MSDNDKLVIVDGRTEENAVLLLEAAGEDNYGAVETTSDGFRVPESLAKKAKLEYRSEDESPRTEPGVEPLDPQEAKQQKAATAKKPTPGSDKE